MKSLRSDNKGQFVIIVALLIAALTLSLVISVQQLSSQRQELTYKPVDELVLGVTSDLERALTYALSNASQEYYQTGILGAAQKAGNTSLLRWQRSVLAAYPQLGLNLKFNEPASFTFHWNDPFDNSGYSHADLSNYELNVGAYGLMGWTGHSEKYVRLVIYSLSYVNESYSTVNFQILQSVNPGTGEVPIPNLTAGDIMVWAKVTESATLEGTPYGPQYLGGGNYSLIFKNPLDSHPLGVTLVVSTPQDRILVSASVGSSVQVVLQSQRINSNSTTPDPHIRIRLGQFDYALPSTITDWQRLQPYLCCLSISSNYVFINWTTTGDISVANPYRNETNVMPYGNGTITVFYDVLQSTSSAYNLTVTSRLDTSSTNTNAGSITFDSVPYSLLQLPPFILATPNHAITYSLNSSMQTQGYTFARWETSTNLIVVGDSYSNSTTITLFGNGTMTAVYQQRSIVLDSYEYNGTTAHLGNIQFGNFTYGIEHPLPAILVPSNVTVANGPYNLTYAPSSSNYTFLWWNITGDIILTGGNTSSTTVRVEGNGSITAVYRVGGASPPESGGTLFVDAHGSQNFWLVFTTPNKDGHLASKTSTGNDKAVLTVVSDPLPTSIYCDPVVIVTAYIGISPPNSPLRILEFELGFTYGGVYYKLGYVMFTIVGSPATRYQMFMDITNVAFPGESLVIPQGSTVTLKLTATFTTPPGGFIFLYYGPSRPSGVTLYQ